MLIKPTSELLCKTDGSSNPSLFSLHMPPSLNLISSYNSKTVMFFLGEVGFESFLGGEWETLNVIVLYSYFSFKTKAILLLGEWERPWFLSQ